MIQTLCNRQGSSRRAVVVAIVLVCATLTVLVEIRWIRSRTLMPERPIERLSDTLENFRNTDEAPQPDEPVPAPPVDASLSVLAAYIRPKPADERWASLGWRYNLREAMELADKTNRMVFLWATNRPMGRC